MTGKDLPTLLRELRNTASFLRHEPVQDFNTAANIMSSIVDTTVLLADRVLESEKAAALAFLDALDEPKRWSEEADKVTRAERDQKHYRLVRSPTGDNDERVHATIVVEEHPS